MTTRHPRSLHLIHRALRKLGGGIALGAALAVATHAVGARGDDGRAAPSQASRSGVLDALDLVQRGEVVELGRVTTLSAETVNPFLEPLKTQLIQGRGFLEGNLGLLFPAFERIEGAFSQQGTQVDSFNHFGHLIGKEAWNQDHWRFANGMTFEEVFPVTARDDSGKPTAYGTPRLGAETIPPIIARGVLVDVARSLGVTTMNPGQAITLAMFRKALGRTELRAGDVVLIHTGWGSRWGDRSYFFTNGVAAEPGIDLQLARHLADTGVVAVGADTFAVEVAPSVDPADAPFPIHQELLGKGRVYLLENLALNDLALRAARDESWKEFLFIMTANKLAGASGSNVSPLAIR